jgi:pimeloyl-ACP methyl ester carboxylesterase
LSGFGGEVRTGDGRSVMFAERGSRDGTPVLYVHGMPSCRFEQRFIPDAVLDRFGVRLVSWDRPGYGGSDPLAGDRVARISDALAVADHLGIDRFGLLAHSAGGSYAVTLAAVAPDRVERVVLSGGQMPYDDPETVSGLIEDQRSLIPVLAGGRSELIEAGVADHCASLLADPLSMLETARSLLSGRERALLERPEIRETFAHNLVAAIEQSSEGLLEDLLAWPHPFEVDLAAVVCPVVAVHGDLDDWEPLANLRRALAKIADVELIVLEGRSHYGPLLHPDLLVGSAAGA